MSTLPSRAVPAVQIGSDGPKPARVAAASRGQAGDRPQSVGLGLRPIERMTGMRSPDSSATRRAW